MEAIGGDWSLPNLKQALAVEHFKWKAMENDRNQLMAMENAQHQTGFALKLFKRAALNVEYFVDE